jgi:hypothetical protein
MVELYGMGLANSEQRSRQAWRIVDLLHMIEGEVDIA